LVPQGNTEVAHGAKVDQGNPVPAQHDVGGMRVGVEDAVHENLAQVDGRQSACNRAQVGSGRRLTVQVAEFRAVDFLQRDHASGGVVPVDAWDEDIAIFGRQAAQRLGVAPLAHIVGLRAQRLGELLHDGHNAVVAHGGRMCLQEAGLGQQDVQVRVNRLVDARALHLHDYRRAIEQTGAVDLADGGRGDGFALKAAVQRLQRPPQFLCDDGLDRVRRGGRGAVQELAEFRDVLGGQDVRPGAEHLPEFDVRRPQLFDGSAQPLRERQGGGLGVRWRTARPPDGHVAGQATAFSEEAEAIADENLGDISRTPDFGERAPHAQSRHAAIPLGRRSGRR